MTDTPFIDRIGGPATARALAHAFYDRVLADPLLLPLFRDPHEPHAERMAWWLIELFGGEPIHTRERGGFRAMVAAHQGLGISEAQRARWVEHMLGAAQALGIEASALAEYRAYVETASRLAMSGSRRAA